MVYILLSQIHCNIKASLFWFDYKILDLNLASRSSLGKKWLGIWLLGFFNEKVTMNMCVKLLFSMITFDEISISKLYNFAYIN